MAVLKIAHLVGWYFPDSVGGTEVYVQGLCRRLRAAGHQTLVAAPDQHRVAPEHYEHDGVPVFRYTITDQPTRNEARSSVAVRGSERLHAWLAEERPDLLHVHSFTTGVGLPEIRAARRLGIRVIVTSHLPQLGYMCRTGELMQWGETPCDGVVEPAKCASCGLTRLGMPRPLARAIGALPVTVSRQLEHVPGRAGTVLGMSSSVADYQAMQRELFDLVDHFVVLNETGRRMLLHNGSPAEKIVLSPLGLSQPSIPRKPGPETRLTRPPVRFGYVGRLYLAKGLLEMAWAVRAIPQEVPFHLTICGPVRDAPSKRLASQLRSMLDGDPRVSFEPDVPGDEVLSTLASLDVLLCPSIGFENGPTVAIEAMAVGTPVIGTRVGNLAELIDDGVNGRLVEAKDVRGLSLALADVARSPATIDAWRRHLPPPRTMDDIAREYLALYAA